MEKSEKIKPQGTPLELEALEAKTEAFTPVEIKKAVQEVSDPLKFFLEAKNE